MNSTIFVIVYILILFSVGIMLHKKVTAKRAVIKETFNIEIVEQKSISFVDPKLHNLIVLNWTLFFVLVTVFLMPVIISGRSILLLVEILFFEAVAFILGVIAVTSIGIDDWHIECVIPQQDDLNKSIICLFASILIVNISYLSYELFEILAIITSLFAFWFTTKPIWRECNYYVS